MPTEEECRELLNECMWEKTVKDNINGYEITGKTVTLFFSLPEGGKLRFLAYMTKRDLKSPSEL